MADKISNDGKKSETATLAAGCFWCAEAIFKRLKGVRKVVPGYAGGLADDATYGQVKTGKTGHAEAVRIFFDPEVISYWRLLEIFWGTHDPTTPNQQGGDIGHQYRSAVFWHNEKQKEIATRLKTEIEASGKYNKPIVTQIAPLNNFFPAEEYHHSFYEKNPSNAYCLAIIDPKIQQLLQYYAAEVNLTEQMITKSITMYSARVRQTAP